jgi:hypothetical protein
MSGILGEIGPLMTRRDLLALDAERVLESLAAWSASPLLMACLGRGWAWGTPSTALVHYSHREICQLLPWTLPRRCLRLERSSRI